MGKDQLSQLSSNSMKLLAIIAAGLVTGSLLAYIPMSQQNAQLQGSIIALQLEREQLRTQVQNLTRLSNALEQQNEALQEEKDDLQDENRFLNNQLTSIRTKLEDWYSTLRDAVNIRLGEGQDKQKFITPDDQEINNLMRTITGGWSEEGKNWYEFWQDLQFMYSWVADNIEDSHDSPTPVLPKFGSGVVDWRMHYWRYPSETISQGIGDSEDQTTLLCSLILAYNGGKYIAWIIELKSDSADHLAVALPVEGQEMCILDPGGNYYDRKFKNYRDAIKDWLKHWPFETNLQITCIFSNTEYETFSTTEEFYDWYIRRVPTEST